MVVHFFKSIACCITVFKQLSIDVGFMIGFIWLCIVTFEKDIVVELPFYCHITTVFCLFCLVFICEKYPFSSQRAEPMVAPADSLNHTF